MLILVSIIFLVSVSARDIFACDRMNTFMRQLPAPGSEAAQKAYFEFLEVQCIKMCKGVETESLLNQYANLEAFYENVLTPVRDSFGSSDRYVPYYYTIEAHLFEKLYEVKFLIAMEHASDSSQEFNTAFKSFNALLASQQRAYPKQVKKLWNAGIHYGNCKQIGTLSKVEKFLPDQSDPFYKRISTYPIDKQLAWVHILLKKSKSFFECIAQTPQKQGTPEWFLYMRACVVNNKPDKFLELFKCDNGTVADHLLMNTLTPFLSTHKKESLKTVAQLLELWAHNECRESHKYCHERYEKIFELIHNNAPFKKMFDLGQCNAPHLLQWMANLHVMIWDKRNKKQSSQKRFKHEQLALLKKVEEYFALIPSSASTILDAKENNERLMMHGFVLCALLAEQHITKKNAYTWCEHALKAGLNLADKKYVSKIALHFSSNEFLKLIEPYLASDCDMTYALGLLYEQGFVKDALFLWLAQDVDKAKDLYTQALNKGHSRSISKLISFMDRDEHRIKQFCKEVHTRFSYSPSFKITQALFFCNVVSAESDHLRKAWFLHKATQEVEKLDRRTSSFSPKDLVYYSALKASLESVAYTLGAGYRTGVEEEAILAKITDLVQRTYHLSLHPQSLFLDVITTFFDSSVLAHLKTYTQKILEKSAENITYQELNAMSLCGYALYRSYGENVISHDDTLFLDKIINVCLGGDVQRRVPPLIHILVALTHLVRDGLKNDPEIDFAHMVSALQQDIDEDKVDVIARYEAEDSLYKLALVGSMRTQMVLATYYKDDIQNFMPTLLTLTKKIVTIEKEEISSRVQWINECGAYVFLKEALLKGSCVPCRSDIATVLLRWLMGLLCNGDESDPQLAPFYEDIQLITSFVNG